MVALGQNILLLLCLICVISFLQGPTHVDAVIGPDGNPVYAKLNLKPGPTHKPGLGTLYTPVRGMGRPPDPKRNLKPPPPRPPHGRPAPPTRWQSLGIKPSGK
ncbi:uncharacterized protein LOC119402872 [Rhipicephalus sanguineus]|uniref:uncharacterized protein LOC119402872 n=1 Tax=Rhipicephalus sanguineus TaxID=34632 RepID=UPI0018946475|nr:uncharacterized protein LOC119402872 [Rhipicephalus sanguineus]